MSTINPSSAAHTPLADAQIPIAVRAALKARALALLHGQRANDKEDLPIGLDACYAVVLAASRER
jgi:hypothetical protein